MDNGHGLVAHSPLVPLYSTEIFIKIHFLLIIDLWILVNLKCNNHSKGLILIVHFHHLGTMVLFSIVCRNSNILFAKCHSMHILSPHLLKVCSLPSDPKMLPTKSFKSPWKKIHAHYIIKPWNGFAITGKELLAHCWISPSHMSYNTNDTGCFLFCPLISFVNKSARLSSNITCHVNDSPNDTELQTAW